MHLPVAVNLLFGSSAGPGGHVESSTIQKDTASIEYVRVQNYLNTELWITKSRWIVIAFLFLYLNVFRLADWPRGLVNSLLVIAALYNGAIDQYIRKTSFFSIKLILLFLYLDMLAVAVGLSYTGGVASPFLFVWYLTLFATGIRFGFKQSLLLLVPMAAFYAYLVHRDMGFDGPDPVNRLVLGVSSLVATSAYGNIFSRGERYTMKVMADFRTAAIMDNLTGLYNYAYFMDRLKHEQFRADRTNAHFSIIIFDLDRFKQVNDIYGHEKGNALLKAVAGILTMNARGMDTVARYGGEEFVVLMPDSRGAEHEMAERIRKKVEETEFNGIAEGPLRITISGGFCTYPNDARSGADVLVKADKALYAAKASGRNRTRSCREM
jgi:diguanylate cyclase (GGDEF)-like protein